MIRHCVLVKFRPDITAAGKEAIYADLRALIGRIDGLIGGSFGPNVSPEGLGKGFNDGFTMDFRDGGARDAYLDDPDHKAAGGKLVAALQGGVDGLVVFDLEV